MSSLHVWIEGRVQGVFFRDATRGKAVELGLSGWVRNLRDGRVEALFQGERITCEKALDFVRSGPPAAVVTRVEHRWEEVQEDLSGFTILY